MNKKLILTLSGVIVVTAAVLVPTVGAYRGDPKVQGPNYTPERHQAMTAAFENNDYNAWKAQMAGRGRVSEVINEQNFSKFAEAHKLALEGKIEEAAKIRAELGLGQNNGSGRGMGTGCSRNGR